MTECGGCNKGEASPNRGDVREGVPTQRGAHYNPSQNAKTPKTHRGIEEYGGIWGACTPLGAYKHMGVYEHTGGIQTWGHPDT